MPSREEKAARLIDEITAAFQRVSREGGVSLHQTRAIDDGARDEAMAEAWAKDVDAHWQDVPESDIEKNDLSMSFLDPIGFRYYLPVYMIWTIKRLAGIVSTNSNNQDVALFACGVHESEDLSEWSKSRFEILSEQQSHAIYKFLLFYTEYGDEFSQEDAQEAIDKYWMKFR